MEESIKNIIALARNLAPIIGALAGTELIGPAIAAGQAVLDLIDGVKKTSGESQEELEASRAELEAVVNAHVDQTIGRLRGDQ